MIVKPTQEDLSIELTQINVHYNNHVLIELVQILQPHLKIQIVQLINQIVVCY